MDVFGGKCFRGTSIGGNLKSEINWELPNIGATDSSNFSAVPGGYRKENGDYSSKGIDAVFWSKTQDLINTGFYRALYNYTPDVNRNYYFGDKRFAFSIRCIKN